MTSKPTTPAKVAKSNAAKAASATKGAATKGAATKAATKQSSTKVAEATKRASAKAAKATDTTRSAPSKAAKATTRAKSAPSKASNRAEAAKRGGPPLSAAEQLDRRIAELGDWRGQRLAELRALIREVDPEAVEEWKWMGTPVWSHQGMYVLANAHKNHVKLQFFHGAQLPDPKRLFNAGLDGNKWRAIDFRETDKLDKPALKALLRAAVAYNTQHSVPKSKGSRRDL